MQQYFIGADFNQAGAVQLDGVPQDTTNWSITIGLYALDGVTLIANLPILWINQLTGLFSISVPGSTTANWPPSKARIDMKVVTDQGITILSPPTFIRIAQSPLS